MKTKTIKGWTIWTRDTTPMEDGDCKVFRAKSDAMDCLYGLYPNGYANTWRIARVTMECEVPVKPKKAIAKRDAHYGDCMYWKDKRMCTCNQHEARMWKPKKGGKRGTAK